MTSNSGWVVVLSGIEDGEPVCQVVAEGLTQEEAEATATDMAYTMGGDWLLEACTAEEAAQVCDAE